MKTTSLTLLTLAALTACHPQSHTPNAASTAAIASKACSSLKPAPTTDALLQQIHSELGSGCLFDLSTAELEAAWGLKVFDYRNQSEEQRDAQFEEMLAYDKVQTALYIKRLPPSPNDFTYNTTDQIQIAKSSGKRYNLGGDNSRYALPAGLPIAFHIWRNPEHRADLPQLVIFADICGAPEEITVYRQALSATYPFYCTDLDQCQATAASAP